MTEVEAIKRTKIRRAELVQFSKEDLENQPNDDEIKNKVYDDKSYESENCGKPWKNYEDEKYITNKELKLVLQIFFEQNTVSDFSCLKTWFNQEKFVFPIYYQCGKIHKLWLEKKHIMHHRR